MNKCKTKSDQRIPYMQVKGKLMQINKCYLKS